MLVCMNACVFVRTRMRVRVCMCVRETGSEVVKLFKAILTA